ncbi:BQ5605_C022g09558 [Microbotryum silenes-dioicae]|uniref:Translation initiation factor eIF2B subunit alpha n=1 Tax=Microbotryum silenes-dioicae TaxID=796604 RepID=A0A2X0MP70_9BASI|nr:BQ5605_C022g09558 [Microbotryum silenes-dioicae]
MGSPRSPRTPSSPLAAGSDGPYSFTSSTSTPLAGSCSSLPTLHESTTLPPREPMDVVTYYADLLASDDSLSMPIAAIETLAQLISQSDTSTTTTELFSLLDQASTRLAQASFNPISLTCGTSLFLRFLTLQRPSPDTSFQEFKAELVARAREFVHESGRCRQLISSGMNEFVRDGALQFVVQALLHAAQQQKNCFQVYVTESRPFGLGLKTQAILSRAGIPCIVVLDSSVAYIMPKCDLVIVGAEAVCESGGLVNFIGSYQVAVVAKAMGKPLYALAESFKFTRLFPLSQYDLPTSLPNPPLTFPDFTNTSSSIPDARESTTTTTTASDSTLDPSSLSPFSEATSSSTPPPPTPSRPMINSAIPQALEMTDQMIRNNPTLDYTTPDLITLIISDLGCLTPSGVSDALLSIFGGT